MDYNMILVICKNKYPW